MLDGAGGTVLPSTGAISLNTSGCWAGKIIPPAFSADTIPRLANHGAAAVLLDNLVRSGD
jgi:hypothetical protein